MNSENNTVLLKSGVDVVLFNIYHKWQGSSEVHTSRPFQAMSCTSRTMSHVTEKGF